MDNANIQFHAAVDTLIMELPGIIIHTRTKHCAICFPAM